MDQQDTTGVIAEAAAQPEQTEQLVPLSALKAERQQRQLAEYQLQMNMQKQSAPAPKDDFQGLSDSDVLTVGDAKRALQERDHQQRMQIEELKVAQSYPDYAEVLRKYLPGVLESDPDLRAAIQSAPNPFKVAYTLAKKSDAYLKDRREQDRSPEAKQAVQNLARPGNLSAVGKGVSGSAAMSYKDMPEKEFMALAQRNLGYT